MCIRDSPYSAAGLESHDEDVMVTEVSSFQLETIVKFHPRAAALLNITEDHLNLSLIHICQRRRQFTAPIGSENITAPIPVISSTGMRRNAGVATVAVFCFLLGVMFLIRLSDMTEVSKSVNNLQARIEQTQMCIRDRIFPLV